MPQMGASKSKCSTILTHMLACMAKACKNNTGVALGEPLLKHCKCTRVPSKEGMDCGKDCGEDCVVDAVFMSSEVKGLVIPKDEDNNRGLQYSLSP